MECHATIPELRDDTNQDLNIACSHFIKKFDLDCVYTNTVSLVSSSFSVQLRLPFYDEVINNTALILNNAAFVRFKNLSLQYNAQQQCNAEPGFFFSFFFDSTRKANCGRVESSRWLKGYPIRIYIKKSHYHVT